MGLPHSCRGWALDTLPIQSQAPSSPRSKSSTQAQTERRRPRAAPEPMEEGQDPVDEASRVLHGDGVAGRRDRHSLRPGQRRFDGVEAAEYVRVVQCTGDQEQRRNDLAEAVEDRRIRLAGHRGVRGGTAKGLADQSPGGFSDLGSLGGRQEVGIVANQCDESVAAGLDRGREPPHALGHRRRGFEAGQEGRHRHRADHSLRMGERHLQHRCAGGRAAGEERGRQAEMIEHGDQVVGVGVGAFRVLRAADAPRIDRDRLESLGQQLARLLPLARVHRAAAAHQDERTALAAGFVGDVSRRSRQDLGASWRNGEEGEDAGCEVDRQSAVHGVSPLPTGFRLGFYGTRVPRVGRLDLADDPVGQSCTFKRATSAAIWARPAGSVESMS